MSPRYVAGAKQLCSTIERRALYRLLLSAFSLTGCARSGARLDRAAESVGVGVWSDGHNWLKGDVGAKGVAGWRGVLVPHSGAAQHLSWSEAYIEAYLCWRMEISCSPGHYRRTAGVAAMRLKQQPYKVCSEGRDWPFHVLAFSRGAGCHNECEDHDLYRAPRHIRM
eukprot:6213707-Pleurochrysis_carterae.AAC.3